MARLSRRSFVPETEPPQKAERAPSCHRSGALFLWNRGLRARRAAAIRHSAGMPRQPPALATGPTHFSLANYSTQARLFANLRLSQRGTVHVGVVIAGLEGLVA